MYEHKSLHRWLSVGPEYLKSVLTCPRAGLACTSENGPTVECFY